MEAILFTLENEKGGTAGQGFRGDTCPWAKKR